MHIGKSIVCLSPAGIMALSTPNTMFSVGTTDVSINPENQFQTFKGWGTSLSWWGKNA